MKNKKTFKVVMLPTEKEALIYKREKGGLYTKDSKERLNNLTPQHLYIISDEEIKDGDQVMQFNDINTEPKLVFQKEGVIPGECIVYKIIASTDKSLVSETSQQAYYRDGYGLQKLLPFIPESFINAYIKAYNEGKPITEVDLDIEEMTKAGDTSIIWFEPRTRPDGSVIVHQSKMYPKSDIKRLLQKFNCSIDAYYRLSDDELDRWIEENL